MLQFNRTELLFGAEAVAKFQASRVAIMGLGGVGSYAAEALARSGIGKFLLVDFDTISETNINRQLPALHSTIGQLKTEAMRQRLLQINPALEITIYSDFCVEESRQQLLENVDFVVDAIDSLTPKAGLIEACYHKKIPLISAMGAAGKFDPAQIVQTDLSKTKICPLAKMVRKYLRRRGISQGVAVIYSTEVPIPQYPPAAGTDQEWVGGRGRKRGTLGSVVYLPAIFGMWAASYVLRNLAGKMAEQ
ncbi:MAG: tRNA threonylcarbamoyladenosine dehydratase [Candidatus Cloacimonadales bacterium]